MIAVLEDTQRLQLLQMDLSVLTAAESVLRTSVSAVTFVSTYDRTTDNHISATSSSKSTDYHKQASKGQSTIETYVLSHTVSEIQRLVGPKSRKFYTNPVLKVPVRSDP